MSWFAFAETSSWTYDEAPLLKVENARLTALRFDDTLVIEQTAFEFQVMDSIMTSADTNILTINVDAPVGLAKLLDETSITLAPNPTSNWLNIEVYALICHNFSGTIRFYLMNN